MHKSRHSEAKRIREAATDIAANRERVRHVANGDEQKFRKKRDKPICGKRYKRAPTYLASFTKGLPHKSETGLVQHAWQFEQFVKAIDSGDPRDFVDTPLRKQTGNDAESPAWKSDKASSSNNPIKVRAWESQSAGNTFDLEGPDAWSVTMPPAPALGSVELIGEMGEVYMQALLRDVPFTDIVSNSGDVFYRPHADGAAPDSNVSELTDLLKALDWFDPAKKTGLDQDELARKRPALTGQTLFRGITAGDDVGPYISQFLLLGNGGINCKDDEPGRTPASGQISYGAVTIDQRVRKALPYDDHMTNWNEWLDVQNGADFRDMEQYDPDVKRRFITTPRDLATYVHYDALFEAYLNACILLLNKKIPFDRGIPFQRPDDEDHQQGFAHFGGPHILSLVTEVATRALKAVRYQKYNVHRRLRPEALAARIAKRDHADLKCNELHLMEEKLRPILAKIKEKNPTDSMLSEGNVLLPMAFCEGSPMHPSYGAGHATVAGACVTILKAFFDHKHPLNVDEQRPQEAYVPINNGRDLGLTAVIDSDGNPTELTVEGELNKLASNISIGRNWAGVHYFSDYIESLRMGEQIAIGILEEQKLTYEENFSMTVPLYDGRSILI